MRNVRIFVTLTLTCAMIAVTSPGCGGEGGAETTPVADAGADGGVTCLGFCNDSDPCTTDSCDPETGKCSNIPIADCDADVGTAADAGTTEDAGTSPVDAGTSPVDAGTSPVDAGTSPVDAGADPVDAGADPVDAGTTGPVDAGVTPVDGVGTKPPGPKVGELVITELHYNPYGEGKVSDADGEWFEVYNTAGHTLDLNGLSIKGPVGDKDVYNIVDGTYIDPGAYFIFGASKDTKVNGGVKVDFAYGNSVKMINGGKDGLIIEHSGVVVDEVVYDTKGGWPYLNGRSMNLAKGKLNATDNDDPKNWCGAQTKMTSGDYGTPGAGNAACDYKDGDNDGVPDDIDNCKNYPNPSQYDGNKNSIGDDCEGAAPLCGNGKVDAGETCDDFNQKSGDGCSKFCLKESKLSVGDLVITEAMLNPKAVSDDLGEWFEIYNTTGADIDLQGVVVNIKIGKGVFVSTIAATKALTIGSKKYFVVAASNDTKINGGITKVDAVYLHNPTQKFPLTSSNAAELELVSQGVIIDSVSWDPKIWPIKNGRSLALDPALIDATKNDDAKSWCNGMKPYGDGDLGSPGEANLDCALLSNPAVQDTDSDGVPNQFDNCPAKSNSNQKNADTDKLGDACDNCPAVDNPGQEDTDKNGKGDICEATAPTLNPGDLLITEIMAKSKAGGGDKGEWVEIHNTTAKDIDMNGVTLQYKKALKKIDTGGKPLVIKGGQYMVFGASNDPTANGGAPVSWVWSGIGLSNVGGELTILAGTTIVDKVVYKSGKPFPKVTDGTSFQLKTASYSALANDDGKNWCLSAKAFGTAGFKGTPGVANDCP